MGSVCGMVLQWRSMGSVHSVLQQRRHMDTSIREEGMPLNWEMIAETVQKYWVQQVCVLVVAVITWWYRRQTKKLKETASDNKAVRMAMVA